MKNIVARIEKLAMSHDKIPPEVIKEKDVKLGLRNADGTGVVVGFTSKGNVVGYSKNYKVKNEKPIVKHSDGKLYYCGYDIEKIVEAYEQNGLFGFDEVSYLLLTGQFPNRNDLKNFSKEITRQRALSKAERRIIMEEVQNENQMYALHSVISHMSRNDASPDSLKISDVSKQCVRMIAKFPAIVANNYNVMRFSKGADLQIRRPKPELSTAENFLYMLKGKIPEKDESKIFDICMILHAEHGGGNNSTFTVRSVSSSGANTYMAIAAGIASLSGYLHGGANESVMSMMKSLKKHVKNWDNDKEVRSYLSKLLVKKAGDRSGKIYGFGHAVYTLSDPRALILKQYAEEMARKKGVSDEFALYLKVEEIAKKLLVERKGGPICSNIDYYSGFIYKMMGIPVELYTPIFAMSRVVGWCAHRIEQIIQGKILRPAYIVESNKKNTYIDIRNRR